MSHLGNTPRSTTVLGLEARRSYAFGMNFKLAADESALDLTGAEVRLVVKAPARFGGAVVITKTAVLLDAALGLTQFNLQSTDLDLDEGEYPFSVTLVAASEYASPVMKGVFDIRDNADPGLDGTYASINPSDQLEVHLEDGDVVEVRVDKVDGLYAIVSAIITDASAAFELQIDAASTSADEAATAATSAASSATSAAASAAAAEAILTAELDEAMAILDTQPASDWRVQNDARLSNTYDAGAVKTIYVDAALGNDSLMTGLVRSQPKATIAAAQTALGASAGIIRLSGGTHTLPSAGITLDASLHSIVGDEAGSILDAAALTAGGVALTVTIGAASVGNSWMRRTQGIVENVEIVGPGWGTDSTGWKEIGLSSTKAVAHMDFHRVVIHEFGTGIEHDDNAYITEHYGFDVYHCDVCVKTTVGTVNGGEKICYYGSCFFNSDLLFDLANVNGDTYLFGCSLDYSEQVAVIADTRLELHGCHVELDKAHTLTPVIVTGSQGTFKMFGGSWSESTPTGASTANYCIDNQGTGMCLLDGVRMNNLNTATGKFANGTVNLRDCGALTTGSMPLQMGQNLLVDGGFENAAILDDVFIGPSGTVTDRFTSTHATAAVSTDTARTGTQSLKITKVTGTTAKVYVLVPIERGQLVTIRGYWSRPGTNTGTVSLSTGVCTVRRDGVPSTVPQTANVGNVNLDLSAGTPIGWTEFSRQVTRAPAWATHAYILVGFGTAAAGSIYLDDLTVTTA